MWHNNSHQDIFQAQQGIFRRVEIRREGKPPGCLPWSGSEGRRARHGRQTLCREGQTYYPKEDRNYDRVGFASWYGSAFHGRYTANGEIYDTSALTAAHPTFPLPSYARVTNTTNGASIIVRVNDRGPYERGRIIDLSSKTAEMLDMKGHGTAKVRVQYVGRARMDGQDQAFLMASYVPKGSRVIPSQVAPGVMVASNDTRLPASALPQRMQMPVAAPMPVVSPSQKRPAPLALSEQANEPIPFQVQSPAFVLLPEVGPIPRVRPAQCSWPPVAPAILSPAMSRQKIALAQMHLSGHWSGKLTN